MAEVKDFAQIDGLRCTSQNRKEDTASFLFTNGHRLISYLPLQAHKHTRTHPQCRKLITNQQR